MGMTFYRCNYIIKVKNCIKQRCFESVVIAHITNAYNNSNNNDNRKFFDLQVANFPSKLRFLANLFR